MPLIITHNDADGIISAASVFMRYPHQKFSLYFASPPNLKLVLCKAISKNTIDNELFVFDLTPSNETIKLARFFTKVIWIDHHIWDNISVEESEELKLVNDVHSPSAARLAAKYFGVGENKIFDWADEIDKNNVKTLEGEYLRDLIDGIKLFYGKNFHFKFKHLSTLLAKRPDEMMNKENDVMVEKFRRWVKEIEESVEKEINLFERGDVKIGVFISKKYAPPRVIVKKVKELGMKIDILALLYYQTRGRKNLTKVELRTLTNYDVFEIAKKLGGGGHKYASGAIVNGVLKVDDFLNLVNS
ncbi:MAG: DHHA1 domain-containing protein [bacterium]|nr:DHHA1 domain-containing protein [bacterium]